MHISQISKNDLDSVGSKALYLSKLVSVLKDSNAFVPNTYVLPSDLYLGFIKGSIEETISKEMNEIIKSNYQVTQLSVHSEIIKNAIMSVPLPDESLKYIKGIYNTLMESDSVSCLAIRSSSSSEDLEDHSFAGKYDSFLNIDSFDEVINAIKLVYASLYSVRAILYRNKIKLNIEKLSMPVIIQEMIVNNEGVSGVAFSSDIYEDDSETVYLSSTYGMCEMIVNGKVTPDEYWVNKESINVTDKQLGFKDHTMTKEGGIFNTLEEKKVCYSLSDSLVEKVALMSICIENAFDKPMDIEWVITDNKELYVVQSRPLTALN